MEKPLDEIRGLTGLAQQAFQALRRLLRCLDPHFGLNIEHAHKLLHMQQFLRADKGPLPGDPFQQPPQLFQGILTGDPFALEDGLRLLHLLPGGDISATGCGAKFRTSSATTANPFPACSTGDGDPSAPVPATEGHGMDSAGPGRSAVAAGAPPVPPAAAAEASAGGKERASSKALTSSRDGAPEGPPPEGSPAHWASFSRASSSLVAPCADAAIMCRASRTA